MTIDVAFSCALDFIPVRVQIGNLNGSCLW